MKQSVIGILAHVDAGKTTLSESMLYHAGNIRKIGRVDHGDAFLDYNSQEKKRGITIFAKQAVFKWKECHFTLIDTPGHIDFSAEMERILQVLDYAIVLINGMDGVQIHTETIWSLLKHYQIPAFVFVNKMDASYLDKKALMKEINQQLSDACIDFTSEERFETAALCDETLLNEYMETDQICDESFARAVAERKIFPCFFGSALKNSGIDTLLDHLAQLTLNKNYPTEFGARIFKITHDEQGNRLTHMKITGGSLKVKEKLNAEEKADQIRSYSGLKYELMEEAKAGTICAVKGLTHFYAGEGIGYERNSQMPILTSYMNYRLILPKGCDISKTLKQLQQLSEEDPQLHVSYQEKLKEIRVSLMGEVQIEILKQLIHDRFALDVEFDQGNVLYKETITEAVEGVGHFEPLRHYAEVHLLLEPLPLNSGLQFSSICLEDELAKNWQRLILTHLQEKEHLGVLCGVPITDMRITLLTGRAHQKHTEGGDFRQATYRAVRQGLKSTKSIVLEPYYQFRLEVPNDALSRAIFDIEQMNGSFELHEDEKGNSILTGSAPVKAMQNYQQEVHGYTKGQGKLYATLKGYEPCADQESVIKYFDYDSETDLENPTGSVFCSQGAGYPVKWDDVKNHMHVKSSYQKKYESSQRISSHALSMSEEEVLAKLFPKNQGTKRKQQAIKPVKTSRSDLPVKIEVKEKCILVDGYNVIYDWPDLSALAKENIDAARSKLINDMCNYQGYKKGELILVFDAYQVSDNQTTVIKNDNIYVVYTKTAQSADMYIEETTHKMAKDYNVTVVSSDAMVQLITSAQGARRMSSRELKMELEYLNTTSLKEYEQNRKKNRVYLLEEIRDYEEKE